MDSNLLLEQYSRFKKIYLQQSPYQCLLKANIDLNPHQINAFCAAIQALRTGGIILADEVGLGKTIEAGLVLDYVLNSGAKRILIVLPAMLRKQWEIELAEKFKIKSTILDRQTVHKDYWEIKKWIENEHEIRTVIASYDYASRFIKLFSNVKWDLIIIDEAHNLRNVFHGTKRASNLYNVTKGIPKILLTATPLQNSLTDLHGLVSFIDPRIFGSEKIFNKHFSEDRDYSELKEKLSPVLYRTLRKDVGKYMNFKKRECHTIDFHLSKEESQLYELVNTFLKRDKLYSIPTNNKGLIILVIRKILASSSFALIETFEVLKKRLEDLAQGTKSANAQEGLDLFWAYVEDEIDEADFTKQDDESTFIQKSEIQNELSQVEKIIRLAKEIKANAKIEALKTALRTAFELQNEKDIPQKVVVFTESKRTQKYIAEELRKENYDEEDILLFNGDFDDAMANEIYHAWQVKNFGQTNYGRNIEYKHAIVDYFKCNAKILIVTDIASEGLNLQFCNTVINYDLPWNPQKIEQRIGRCHRYGQMHDVVAINLLNTDNEADKRVYEILRNKFELFDGVFGSSDIALGVLESGSSFEKSILEIYQKCDSQKDFDQKFDILDHQLDSSLNSPITQLKNLLLTTESPESKENSLNKTRADIKHYLDEVTYWNQFSDPEMDAKLYYWRIDNWGIENLGGHGFLFIGAFCDNDKVLFPILLLCDEEGNYIDFEEHDIVKILENANDSDIHFFQPTSKEEDLFDKIYDEQRRKMITKYNHSVEPIMKYNRMKLENWKSIQEEQLQMNIRNLRDEIEQYIVDANNAIDYLEKKDIQKKVVSKQTQLNKFKKKLPHKITSIKNECENEIKEFNKQFTINPLLLINIVLKF